MAYHFFKDFDPTAAINDRNRTTYDGPLSVAVDDGVWNITKDDIRVRMAMVDEDVWPPPATEKPQTSDPSLRISYSDEIVSGKLDVEDVIQPTLDEINKKYGLNEKQDGTCVRITIQRLCRIVADRKRNQARVDTK